MKAINVLLVALIVFSITDAQAQKKLSKKEKNMILEYYDGSANYYKITSDSIIYDPVTPEMSSSGIYSGGIPKRNKISEEIFNQVLTEFNLIFKNKAIHIPDRIKTSGVLVINKSGNKTQEVIIKQSNEQEHLEQLLKSFLNE